MQQFEDVMKHYENGREIFTIARKTGLTEREVLRIVHQFMRDNSTEIDITSYRHINDKLADVIRSRFVNEIDQTQIAKELDVPLYPIRAVCSKATEHMGSKTSFEEKYTLLEDIVDLKQCPNCPNKQVYNFETYADRRVVEGMYCNKCENEYFKLDEKVYKINFEYID